ncbi:MAG: AAA family ATPase [Candidatus Margulisiibacteriota bacterium]
MYLRKIEIQGFKTFADRTVIDFSTGANITAVVGPNGCGKSNFLEAVRWGMGEQSVKLLRSSSAPEIIFSGNKDRKSVSLAEVEISIDNSKKMLPLDYSEITIKRKLYRSGESEYFLNKTPCRLKDIHDLFLDTGVGKNSYSIIGQGQIDVLINMKPDEKKMMFEEAAGINKYKHRKRQALRKLETTNQNLNRLTDLRSEISSQIDALAHQSKEAETYLELKEELKTIEISSFKSRVLILRKQKAEVQKKINELRDEILQISEQTSSNDHLKLEHKKRIAVIEFDIQKAQEKRETLNKEIETIRTALLVNAERTQNQQHRLEQLAGEMGSMEATLKMVEEQQKETETELDQNKQDVKRRNQEISTKEREQKEDRTKLNSMQLQIAEKREKLNSDKSRLNLLEEMQKTHEGYFQGVRAILEARDESSTFPGIKGVVANLIETDKKYEQALETALGAHLQDVVADTDATAKKAIIHLRENGLGRATFLPLNLIRNENDGKDESFNFEGIIGLASDLVSCKPEFRPIVLHLLGNVLVAEDMDAALYIVRNHRTSRISRVVTLSGEIVMMSGAMTGGSSARKTVPLLGRQRLIMELKKGITDALKIVEKMTAEVIELSRASELRDDELLKNKIKAGQLTEHISQAEVKLQALLAAREDNQKKIDDKASEQQETRDRLAEAEKTIAEKEQLLPQFEADVEKLQKEESALSLEKQDLQNKIEAIDGSSRDVLHADRDLREKLGHAEVQMARVESDYEIIEDRLQVEYESSIEEVLHTEMGKAVEGSQEENIEKIRRRLKRMEPVNLLAIEEYKKQSEREFFISNQFQDLNEARENLNKLILELDNLARKDFIKTIAEIQVNFQETFSQLFEGGRAEIKVLDNDNVLESGVDIFVHLPRKKSQAMSLLSGGEKALTAVALIFALLKTRPAPFCILDEVDAALDESNIRKFSEMLASFSLDSQMIVITHNKQTITAADAIYGITMQEPGVSKVVSVKMQK